MRNKDKNWNGLRYWYVRMTRITVLVYCSAFQEQKGCPELGECEQLGGVPKKLLGCFSQICKCEGVGGQHVHPYPASTRRSTMDVLLLLVHI